RLIAAKARQQERNLHPGSEIAVTVKVSVWAKVQGTWSHQHSMSLELPLINFRTQPVVQKSFSLRFRLFARQLRHFRQPANRYCRQTEGSPCYSPCITRVLRNGIEVMAASNRFLFSCDSEPLQSTCSNW